jgi:phenylalanyl-tRNA synthetase beta subunit
LLKAAQATGNGYKPLSRFPSTERDICFQVNQAVSYAAVNEAAQEALGGTNLDYEVSPLDIYQPETGDTKNVTLRIQLTSYNKTLTGDEIAAVMTQLAEKVSAKIGATVV